MRQTISLLEARIWIVGMFVATAVFVYYNVDGKDFHYHDAELYISAAHNLSEGRGTFSRPVVGRHHEIPFTEHPPGWIGAQALWYRLFGFRRTTTNAFPATMLLLAATVTAVAAVRATGNWYAALWVFLTCALDPSASKFRHEAVLDWGLAIASAASLLAMAAPSRSRPWLTGLLLGLAFGAGFLVKGAFAFALLAGSLYYVTRMPTRGAMLAGLLGGVAIGAVAWAALDAPDWTVTRSMFGRNVAGQLGESRLFTIWEVIRAFLVRNAPWSLLVIVGAPWVWRRGLLAQTGYVILAVTLVGFLAAGKSSAYYWLMVVPVLGLLVSQVMTGLGGRVEKALRVSLVALFLTAQILRPFVPLERPSNRATTEREFLRQVQEKLGYPPTLGYFDANDASTWYLMTYGWNHFGVDLRLVCLDGEDEPSKYEDKLTLYLLPCDAGNRPDHFITLEKNWTGRESEGEIVVRHEGLVLVRITGD